MKYKEYSLRVLTKPEAMYTTYECAKLLNPTLTYENYKITIDHNAKTINYRQVIMICDGVPVAFAGIHDTLLMKNAPNKSLNLANIATLPEHRGQVTKVLLKYIEALARSEGYGNIDIRSNKQNDIAAACYEKAGYNREESFAWRKYLTKDITPKDTKWQNRITEEKESGTIRARL